MAFIKTSPVNGYGLMSSVFHGKTSLLAIPVVKLIGCLARIANVYRVNRVRLSHLLKILKMKWQQQTSYINHVYDVTGLEVSEGIRRGIGYTYRLSQPVD